MPERIVSLVPSLTELVFWLGRGDRLVGRTSFCTEPSGMVEEVRAVGGTKTPDIAAIRSLKPDLVLANREENRREDVEALRDAGIDVLVTNPATVEEACAMTLELGELLAAGDAAASLAAETREEVAQQPARESTPVFVAIWKQPLMGLGGDSYGSDILAVSGGRNVTADLDRYPHITMEDVAERKPGLVLLPDEPYRFRERDTSMFGSIAPARVIDGKLLWWYGPRMPGAIRQLRKILAEAAE